MRFITYYEHYNRSVGRIKELDAEHNQLLINVCAGHGGGEMKVPWAACYDFEPQVDDRILLCIDQTTNAIALLKLKKTRQEKQSRFFDPTQLGQPEH